MAESALPQPNEGEKEEMDIALRKQLTRMFKENTADNGCSVGMVFHRPSPILFVIRNAAAEAHSILLKGSGRSGISS